MPGGSSNSQDYEAPKFLLVFGLSLGLIASGQSGTGGDWQVLVSPYLWFPGIHGTVGAFDREASFSASPIDVLSHFRFGLMGAADARWQRLVLSSDLLWVRLADDKAAAPGPRATTADVKVSMFMLTPKVGVRLLDEPKIKCDFLTGVRYWHIGLNLNFSPSIRNLNSSASQDWLDPLVGGRIESLLSVGAGHHRVVAAAAGGRVV
jgi:hypothetical protein